MDTPTNDLWYFYNQAKKKKLGPFTINALCEFVVESNISLDQIILCQKGWAKWKKGLDVTEFITEYQTYLQNESDLFPSVEDVESSEQSQTTVLSFIHLKAPNLLDEEKDWTSVRKHQRLEAELKIVFVAEKKTFRTKSKDLSLGGIKISDPLPEFFFNKTIQVFISSPDLKISIKFEAKLLPNKSSLTQIQFISQNDISLKHLESWINTMTSQSLASTKLKKSA